MRRPPRRRVSSRIGGIAPEPASRVSQFAAAGVPFGLGLAGLVLDSLPYGQLLGTRVAPAFLFMNVFYWAAIKPDYLPPPLVFLLGLSLDLITGGPIGLNALVLVVVYTLVARERRLFAGKPLPVVWLAFAIVSVAAALLTWLIASVFYGALQPALEQSLDSAMTIALYPLFDRLGQRLRAIWLGASS